MLLFQIVFIYADPLRISGFLSLGPATWWLVGTEKPPGLCVVPVSVHLCAPAVGVALVCPQVAQLPAQPSPSWQLVPARPVLARALGALHTRRGRPPLF